MKLTFTIPPSVNECYAGYRVRHKSKKYKEWIEIAEIQLLKQEQYKIHGNEWLEATIIYFLPLYYKNWNKKKQDLDNLLKPLFDLLWDNIPWFKDEHIKKIITSKIDSERKEVEITIKEIWIK